MASTIGCVADESSVKLPGLPHDLLFKILIHLRPRDIVSVSLCCKHLYEICNIDILWKYILQYRCDFNLSSAPLINDKVAEKYRSCKDIASDPYRYFVQHHFYHLYPLVGLWLFNLCPYNIVMKISPMETVPYLLQGCLYYLGAHKTILSDQVPSLDIATFLVQQGDVCNASSAINFTVSTDESYYDRFKPCQEFELCYQDPRPHNAICNVDQLDFLQISEHDPYGKKRYDLLNSRVALKRPIRVSKISVQQSKMPQSAIILPGVYKGTFSSPTLQLVLVYYQSGWLYCKKLTGDVNIPGGKVILKVRPRNIIGTPVSFPIDISLGHSYSFDVDIPAQEFVACYNGEAQIAQRGYLYPGFCRGKMYVADTASFVFVTEGDYSNVSYFRRCNSLSNFL